jgi:hypothetical protein
MRRLLEQMRDLQDRTEREHRALAPQWQRMQAQAEQITAPMRAWQERWEHDTARQLGMTVAEWREYAATPPTPPPQPAPSPTHRAGQAEHQADEAYRRADAALALANRTLVQLGEAGGRIGEAERRADRLEQDLAAARVIAEAAQRAAQEALEQAERRADRLEQDLAAAHVIAEGAQRAAQEVAEQAEARAAQDAAEALRRAEEEARASTAVERAPADPAPGPNAGLKAHDRWLLREWARRHPNLPAELAARTATIAQWLTELEPQARTISKTREPRTIKNRLRPKLQALIDSQRKAQSSR